MKPVLALALCLATSCAPLAEHVDVRPLAAAASQSGLEGMADDDPEIRKYVLRNRAGMVVRFLNYGGAITAIEAADRNGRRANVVLGYGSDANRICG